MIRWFPCDTWHHSGSFIVMKVWGCTAGFLFSFYQFYQNYLFWNNCFLDGSMWFLLFLAPLCKHVSWNLAGSHFFKISSLLGESNHFWNKSGFFQMVPWFPVFSAPLCLSVLRNPAGSHFQISSPLGEINHFLNKIAFLDGSMWFLVFSAPLCLHVIWNLVGSHFQIFSPLGGNKSFLEQKCIFRWFHVVASVFFGSVMLTCYMEPQLAGSHFQVLSLFW